MRPILTRAPASASTASGAGAPRRLGPRLARVAAAPLLLAASLAGAAATTAPSPDPGAGSAGPRAAAGRLVGTVEVGPELSTRRIRFQLYPDLTRTGEGRPAAAGEPSEAGNVVIYLESVPGALAPAASGETPRTAVQMRQEGLSFVPHVLAVLSGTEVSFPNGDPIFHNVFSLSKAARFDLGRFPRGDSRSVRFERPGVVKVFCHLHADMSGIILVLDNPYFAIPDAAGRYAIEGIPPGEYALVGWHERIRPLRTTVRIESGRTSVLDLGIPLGTVSGE